MLIADAHARILYIQYGNPAAFPPLEHSSRLLAEGGWEVMFLGARLAGGADNLRFPSDPRIKVCLLPACRWRLLAKVHYAIFAILALTLTVWWRPTWVYASDMLACPVALLVSLFLAARVAYHEHDFPSGGAESVYVRLCMAARSRIARRALLCVLPNVERARLFKDEVAPKGPIMYVPNFPSKQEVVPPRTIRVAQALRLYYHGSIVPPRLPMAAIQALALLPTGVCLRVVGYETVGHLGYLAQLCQEAKHLGVRDRIELIGVVSRRDTMMQLCRECDVGLALMPTASSDLNMNEMAGASNKPFDYLACGLALLVADLPDWRAWYVEPGYGVACNPSDSTSIACAVRWFLEHPREVRAMGEWGRQKILSTWNYELAFAPVQERMQRNWRRAPA